MRSGVVLLQSSANSSKGDEDLEEMDDEVKQRGKRGRGEVSESSKKAKQGGGGKQVATTRKNTELKVL